MSKQCKYQGCKGIPIMHCKCEDQQNFFCRNHLSNHLSISRQHNLFPLIKDLDPDEERANLAEINRILKYLEELQRDSMLISNSLIQQLINTTATLTRNIENAKKIFIKTRKTLLTDHFIDIDQKNAIFKTTNYFYEVHRHLLDPDEPINFFTKCEKILATIGTDCFSAALINSKIGFNRYYKRMYKDAMNSFEKSLQEFKSTPDHKNEIARIYIALGNCNHYLSNYSDELNNFIKGLHLARETFGDDHFEVALAMRNIGCYYKDQKVYDKALEFLIKCKKTCKKILCPYDSELALVYMILGVVHKSLKQRDFSLKFYKKAENIREKNYGKSNNYISRSFQ